LPGGRRLSARLDVLEHDRLQDVIHELEQGPVDDVEPEGHVVVEAGQQAGPAPAIARFQDERPRRVAEARPEAFLADPLNARMLELKE
jgi:hypothetical protein